MKKIYFSLALAATIATSLARVSVLLALVFTCGLCLFGNPEKPFDTDLLFWINKCVAVSCAYLIYRIYPLWAKTDKWIGAYDRWCRDLTDED